MRGAAAAFGSGPRLAAAERASGLSRGRAFEALSSFSPRRRRAGGRHLLGRLPGPGAAWTDARDLPVHPPSPSGPGGSAPTGAPDERADYILGAVRDALGSARRPVDVPPLTRPEREADVELFAERVADYRATVVRCSPPDRRWTPP